MRFFRFGIPLVMSAVMMGPAVAQTTVDGVSARLVGKVLFLRGTWGDSKLSFDADGQPLKKYKTGSFTESGIKISSVKMAGPGLRLQGERIVIGFDQKGKASLFKGGKTTIDINSAPDFSKALNAIFAPDLPSLIPSMPDYWLPYATKYFSSTGIAARQDKTLEEGGTPDISSVGTPKGAMHIGGPIKPPRVLESAEPSYTDVARDLKFTGDVEIYLWVGEDGSQSHLQIERPAGVGLDEAAIESVKKYRFAPATQNGKPVKVDLYIDVNFQIF